MFDKSTRQNKNNLLYSGLWNLKWFDKPRTTYYHVSIMPTGLPLGFKSSFSVYIIESFQNVFEKGS